MAKFSVLICVLIPLLMSCSQQSDNKIIRVGHTLDTQHAVHKAMVFFSERLSEYSSKTLEVKLYPGGQLGSERELVELLQIGSLDMTKVSASSLEGFAPDMQIFSIPYVFNNNEHLWEVLNGNIGQSLLKGLNDFRLHGVGYYDAGSRSFYTNDKPIYHPDDLNGLKIRVLNSPTAMQTVRQLGGAATPIAWGELYTALQQGVVDGAENNPPSYFLSRHYEIARYYTLDEHTSVPDVMVMSLRTWNGLSKTQQEWVNQAMLDSIEYQRQIWQESTDAALSALEADGVQIIYPDKAPFMDAVAPMHDALKGTKVGDKLNQIKALRQ